MPREADAGCGRSGLGRGVGQFNQVSAGSGSRELNQGIAIRAGGIVDECDLGSCRIEDAELGIHAGTDAACDGFDGAGLVEGKVDGIEPGLGRGEEAVDGNGDGQRLG
jgi:hypothetical protein